MANKTDAETPETETDTWVRFEPGGQMTSVEVVFTRGKGDSPDTVTVDYEVFAELLVTQGWSRRLREDEKVAANLEPEPGLTTAEAGPATPDEHPRREG